MTEMDNQLLLMRAYWWMAACRWINWWIWTWNMPMTRWWKMAIKHRGFVFWDAVNWLRWWCATLAPFIIPSRGLSISTLVISAVSTFRPILAAVLSNLSESGCCTDSFCTDINSSPCPYTGLQSGGIVQNEFDACLRLIDVYPWADGNKDGAFDNELFGRLMGLDSSFVDVCGWSLNFPGGFPWSGQYGSSLRILWWSNIPFICKKTDDSTIRVPRRPEDESCDRGPERGRRPWSR